MKSFSLFLLRFFLRKIPVKSRITLIRLLIEDKEETSPEIRELVSRNEIYNPSVRKFTASIPGFNYMARCFGQNGEDLILRRLLEHHPVGRYIDVGAHHPFRFSNTALLYTNGWRGINIEPNPESIDLFGEIRPEDLSLQLALGAEDSVQKYYCFNESALNTFLESRVKELDLLGIHPTTVTDIQIRKSAELLVTIFTSDTYILNIDVEGLDLEIVGGLNYSLFHPCFILIEFQNCSISEATNLLSSHNYLKNYFVSEKALNTFILRSRDCEGLHG